MSELARATDALERWPGTDAPSPRPKKRFGQHFLINRGVLGHVLDAAELTGDDLVVEVGPGPGVLTRGLLGRAGKVVAVEIDRDLAGRLREEMGADPRFRLVEGDILNIPIDDMLGQAAGAPCPAYKVAANLPYNVAAAVLRTFLTASCHPQRLVVMVQLEVARSIVAGPGKLGILGVAVQFYGRPQIVCEVAPGSFFPPPKVRSAVVKIDVYDSPPVAAPDAATFFQVVRAGFGTARKQLHNALTHALGLSPDQTHRLLESAGIDPKRRAETLSIEEWGRLGLGYQRTVSAG